MSAEADAKTLTKFAMASMNSSIKAITRIVHLNLWNLLVALIAYMTPSHPISSIKLLAAIGMTPPPIDDPVAAIPNANDLRFLNHCAAMVGIGPKIIPQHAPVRKPWQRRNCQNFLHSAVTTVAATRITLVWVR